MESLSGMLNTQTAFPVYLAVGMHCMKAELIDRETKKELVNTILKIILPCMIFNSFNRPPTPGALIQTALTLMMVVTIPILSFLLGKVIYDKYPQKEKDILRYYILVNNSGPLEMPMVSAVYGSDGLFAASIFIIPNRIFMRTAGLVMLTTVGFGAKCRNVLLNPCIATIFLGIVRRITGSPAPDFLNEAITNIGIITAPLSMMVIGTMPIEVPWKKLLEPSTFYLAFVHLITLSLVVLFILSLTRAEPMLTGISLTPTGTPTGNTSALPAAKYEADKDYTSRYIITATTMSLATIPVLMLLL